MASTEVDKTSYYGKQTLHYLDTKGETALVSLSKLFFNNLQNIFQIIVFIIY